MFAKRVPYVQQLQETECGLCCISMIMKYYGSRVSMSFLKNNYVIGRDGMSMKEIGNVFTDFNYDIRYYKSNVAGLEDLNDSPCILFCDNSHYIVLEKIVNDKYYIVDPRIGREVLDKKLMKERYNGYALKPVVREDSVKFIEDENEENIYYDFISKNKGKLVLLLVLSISAYLVALVVPAILKKVIDDVVYSNNIKSLNVYLMVLLSVMLLYMIVTYLQSDKTIYFSKIMDDYTYKKVINKLFSVPYDFFLTRNSSDLLYRLSLLKSNRNYLIDKIINSIFHFANLLVLLIVLLIINMKLFGLVLLISFIVIMVLSPLQNKIMSLNRKSISSDSELQAKEYETLNYMYAIKAMGLSQRYKKKIFDLYNKSISIFVQNGKTESLYQIISNLVSMFIPALVVLVFTHIDRTVSIGTIFYLYTILIYYYESLGGILSTLISFNQFKLNDERIKDILLSKSDEGKENMIRINEIEKVEFKNVSYKYPGQKKYALKDISFTLNRGEQVGLVGKTGSGKTTLLSLMMGMIKPTEGEVLINNQNILDLDVESFREKVGYVPQESFIISSSIKNNIIMEREVTDEEFINALKVAELVNDITALPMKENTLISEDGKNLSGGQRQRIGIARALLKKPSLIVFDEATSSVDNYTQNKISEAIGELSCMQFIVSHRLSTIENSHKILVIEGGKIVEEGTSHELIGKKGLYYELYQKEI